MKPVLILNAGSSSLKFAVFQGIEMKARGQISGIGAQPELEAAGHAPRTVPEVTSSAGALQVVLRWLSQSGWHAPDFAGIGHRIVHGGIRFVKPVVVNDAIQGELEALRHLAPLHLPFGLSVLRGMRDAAPGVPSVACFDTAFHAAKPAVETRLPLPRAYFDRGYRRYGFHGLAYEHVVGQLPLQTGAPLPRRLLAAHLGSGASMCAILDGRSVATTMGFSTADGLMMGTRTGAIDPGALVALMRDDSMSLDAVEDLLYRRSGLLGLSGLSADMRVLLASDRPESAEAVEQYCYSAARQAASLVPALGGLDAIVFSGGVGENAAEIRTRILARLAWLGLSECQIHVVTANEEQVIASHVYELFA